MRIYTFYRYDNPDISIHIGAMTTFEAVDALNELDSFASSHYNMTTYKTDFVNPYAYIDDVDPLYTSMPIFLSERQYQDIIRRSSIKYSGTYKKENEKYNSAIFVKNDKSFSDTIDRIDKANDKWVTEVKFDPSTSTYVTTKKSKVSNENRLAKKMVKDINKNLQKYVGELNNRKTRKDIEKDITKVYDKYKDEIDNTIKDDVVSQLQKKIKGED